VAGLADAYAEREFVVSIGATPLGRHTMKHVDTTDGLVRRARRLVAPGTRSLLGIAGPPGCGKSTLAEAIVAEFEGLAILVPMDGFHLSNSQLRRLGRRQRKGAPDTFDANGYVSLLRRLAANEEDTVFAPEFRREQEEAIAGAIAIPRSTPLVVTEGNYILMDEPPWAAVRGLLSEAWYLDLDPATRVDRLIRRHVYFGKTQEEARGWVHNSDEVNAGRVVATRHHADVVVTDWGLDQTPSRPRTTSSPATPMAFPSADDRPDSTQTENHHV
jgi:pantothenate kinase